MFAVHWVDGWWQLGAHPFWSLKATLYGVVGGSVVFVLPGHRRATVALAWFGLAALALAISHWGRWRWTESSATERLAGLTWYIGFAVAIGALVVALATVVRVLVERRQRLKAS